MFEAVTTGKKPLAERVSDQIVGLIAGHNLVGGQKLPNEFELARMLDVGRGTVREAVKLLVSRNVLEIQRGKGTYVCRAPGRIEDPFGLAFISDKHRLTLDMAAVRRMLEPQIAALAALNADRADVAEMRALCDSIGELANRGEDYVSADIALHARIAQSTRNIVIPNLIPVIAGGIELFNGPPYYTERVRILEMHHRIIDAIEARDPDAAAAAMVLHLDTLHDIYRRESRD